MTHPGVGEGTVTAYERARARLAISEIEPMKSYSLIGVLGAGFAALAFGACTVTSTTNNNGDDAGNSSSSGGSGDDSSIDGASSSGSSSGSTSSSGSSS